MAITVYAGSPEEAINKFNHILDQVTLYVDSSMVDKHLECNAINVKKTFPNLYKVNNKDIKNFVDGRLCTKIRLRDLDVTKHFGLNEGSIFINIQDKVPVLCKVSAFVQPPFKFKVKRITEKYITYRQLPPKDQEYGIYYDDKDLYGALNGKAVAGVREFGSIETEPIFLINEILDRKICDLNTGCPSSYRRRHTKKLNATVSSQNIATSIVKLDLVELGSLYHHLVGMINENVELNS